MGENIKIDISDKIKKDLEEKIIDIVIKYQNRDYIDCITLMYYMDADTWKSTVAITLICDNEDNCKKLEEEVANYKDNVEDISIRIGYTYKQQTIESRKKSFKSEKILVDKKNYKDLQESIKPYKCNFQNMVELKPQLVLKNNR